VREALQGRRARLEGRTDFAGRKAYFQAHLIPDRDDGGTQRGFYLMTFDVTALKEAEDRRARVEGQLRAITDNLPVAITYMDAQQRYRFVNRTGLDWLERSPDQVLGSRVSEVLKPDAYERRRENLERALGGERVTFEVDATVRGAQRCLHYVYVPDIEADGLALSRARRAGSGLGLMYLDIDRFKSINDSLGHATGDEVLKAFARRLQQSVRMTDTVARLGGDEFVIILEGLHVEEEAHIVARKIIANVAAPLQLESGRMMQLTTSIGVALRKHVTAHDPPSVDALIARADEALYQSKEAGRNTYRVLPGDLQPAEGPST
jgi:diguanylate cyclase (GGDEF)-like protein/PAS domain S-box-containing protein